MNMLVKFNAATAAGKALNSCSGTFVGSEMAGGSAYIPPYKRTDRGAHTAAIPGKHSNSNIHVIPQEALSLPYALRLNMEAALEQLGSDASQEFESIWWEEGSCSLNVPRGTPKEQRQWQERLQAAAQQAYDDTPDYSDLYPIPSNGAASFDWNMFRETRVAHLQRFLGDLPSLTAKWGRVAADASWFHNLLADPVSCAWLGKTLISNWLFYVALCTDELTDAVIKEACAIRRERVLAPVLVSTPVSQVLAPVAPQELQSQKLVFLTKRANRTAGMQMIVHSPHVIYPVKYTREQMMLLLVMGRALATRHCTVPQSALVLPGTSSSAGGALQLAIIPAAPLQLAQRALIKESIVRPFLGAIGTFLHGGVLQLATFPSAASQLAQRALIKESIVRPFLGAIGSFLRGLPAAPIALVLCPMAVLESALKLGDKPASGAPPLTDTFSSHDITVGNIDSAYIPAYSGGSLKETFNSDAEQQGSGSSGTFISKLVARMKAGIKKAASVVRGVSSVLHGLLGFHRH